jgi:hypothetical protein
MKNKFLLVFFILFSISSCSKNADKNQVKLKGDLANLPSWVIDSSVPSGVAAVGIASPSVGGIKFQIPKAELDAKANIASTISSEISRVTKNALRESKINDVNDVEDFFSQATKEVVKDLPLSGIKRLNMFQGNDGTLYIQMVLNNEDYTKFLQNSEKNFKDRLKKSTIGRDNINKSEEASTKIFDELEKERKAD